MKTMFIVVTAVLFTLGFAGLSFSEDMAGMNHANHAGQKTCGIANCCEQHKESLTKDSQSKSQEGNVSWSSITTLQPTPE
ncbi:MAG: hypothetical protein M1497_03525 [Nitrospirae bacterium]|nr:hypothetical protein [Nitrospirota bacterium]